MSSGDAGGCESPEVETTEDEETSSGRTTLIGMG